MIDHFPLPLQGRPERKHLYRWIREEERYVAAKFDDSRNGHDDSWQEDFNDFWARQIVQYFDRVQSFLTQAKTENDPSARRALEMRAQQALAKALMTLKGCVESSIRTFGPLPTPGVSSGTIMPWMDLTFELMRKGNAGDSED